MKVCPRCGRTEKETPFIGFFCRDCYLEEHEVVRFPKKLEIGYCVSCERIYTDRWAEFSLDELSRWLRKKARIDADDAYISFSFPELDEDRITFLYVASGTISGVPIRVEGGGEIKLKRTLCPRCARESGGYYEAIIQIRGKDVYTHAREIERMVVREKGEYNFISKVVERKEGIDLYVGSRKIAEKIAKKIEKKYSIKPVKSYTLVTEKEGKRLYRVTIALHFE